VAPDLDHRPDRAVPGRARAVLPGASAAAAVVGRIGPVLRQFQHGACADDDAHFDPHPVAQPEYEPVRLTVPVRHAAGFGYPELGRIAGVRHAQPVIVTIADPALTDGSRNMPASVPVIDLAPWFSGDETARATVAAEVDAALQSVGFFLITGHGVPGDLRAQIRAAARAFFAQPRETKQRYAVTVGGRGWLPPGAEANAYAEGTETPPDLKESYAVGADQPTGDPEVDGYWFQPNVYPAEVPALEPGLPGPDPVADQLSLQRPERRRGGQGPGRHPRPVRALRLPGVGHCHLGAPVLRAELHPAADQRQRRRRPAGPGLPGRRPMPAELQRLRR
jgi:non-haem dioxygenase in morphine synthesis N-terminal